MAVVIHLNNFLGPVDDTITAAKAALAAFMCKVAFELMARGGV